jgi:small GTP-binding protein
MRNSIGTYKLILIGDSSVGKTNLLTQYVDGKTSENIISTIGIEFKNKIIELENRRKIRLQIWDTSGQEKFKALTKNYFRGCDAALFVFDVTNKDSFDNIKDWLKLYYEVNGENSKKILIGNKIDKENRVINKIELKNFAEDNGLKPFEISVKNKEGIDEMFKEIIKLLIEPQIEDKNFINDFNHKSDKDYNLNSNEIILKNNNDINYSNSNRNIDRKNSIKLRTDQHNIKVKKKWRC